MNDKNSSSKCDQQAMDNSHPAVNPPEQVPQEISVRHEEFMAMVASISPENSTANKLTPEHIDKFLDNSKIAMEKEYEDRKHRRVWNGIMLVLLLAVVIVIVVLMRDKPSEMRETIAILAAIAAAVFGGYGFGKTKNRNDDD